MVAYAIGIFFIVAGIMNGPYGFGPLAVGIVICCIKFYKQYGSVDNFTWTKTFEKSSVVKEIVDEINAKNIKQVQIQSKFISYGDKMILFKDRGIGNLTMDNCKTLAETIRNMMNDSSKFKVQPMSKYIGGGSGHDRPIGMTQTANGNYVFDYGDSGSFTERYGYQIVPNEKPKKAVKTTTKPSEWK